MHKKLLPKKEPKKPVNKAVPTPQQLKDIQNARIDLDKSKKRLERLRKLAVKGRSSVMTANLTGELIYHAMLESWIEYREIALSDASFQETTAASTKYYGLKKRWDNWLMEKRLKAIIKAKGKEKGLMPLK